VLLLAGSLLLAAAPVIGRDALPGDAAKRIKDFEEEAEAIRKKADAEILTHP
jgi:hypothetical protein